MAKAKTTYLCQACGYRSPVHLGRCPECNAWDSLEPETTMAVSTGAPSPHHPQGWDAASPLPSAYPTPTLLPLNAIAPETLQRFSTGYGEFDRVLGGGLLPGAYILIAGDPGIGKSTLMLQSAAQLATSGKTVWYVAGEESPQQIQLRAQRLGLDQSPMQVVAEVRLPAILALIQAHPPDVLVIDSIQALYDPAIPSAPGSTTQIRSVANQLMPMAKLLGVTILVVGHVTKEGQVSGPKLLEHMVDVVVTFEGEKYKELRLLRTLKNRFGSTQEIGVFEMVEGGLRPVDNPSELFLGEQWMRPLPGCVTTCTLEGSRPLLVEIQALVGQSTYPSPRRVVNGVETSRLHQIVAVLERRLGLDFSTQDLYVNVVGGMTVEEPAADLAIAMALVTSLRNLSLTPGTVVLGEIGLTGELRPARRWQDRLREAAKIGFQRLVYPPQTGQTVGEEILGLMATTPVTTVMDAVTACLHPGNAPLTPVTA